MSQRVHLSLEQIGVLVVLAILQIDRELLQVRQKILNFLLAHLDNIGRFDMAVLQFSDMHLMKGCDNGFEYKFEVIK